MKASYRLSVKRSLISSVMGAPVHIDVPKSNRRMPPIQSTNCHHSGRSSPSRARSVSRFSFWAKALSPAKRSSTMSPGTTRMRKNTSTATLRSVGIISKTRLTMYWITRADRLPGQPHRVELLVQVVAGRDGPAVDLRVVGNDAVPLQGIDVVDLLVEEPPLEVPDRALAPLHVAGLALLLVELVERPVDVAAVVRRALVLGLELVQIEVRVHRVATLEVRGHVEAAAAQLRVVLGGLDDLLPHVEPDLPPLVDQPHADRLVGHRHAAVLVHEREALGDPGLLEQPPRLRARLGDVAGVAGELLQLRRRRRERGAGDLDAADLLDDGDLGQRRRALIAIEGQRERAAHALVVERLVLVVHGHEDQAVPGTLLHR